MSLSQRTKDIVVVAMADKKAAEELSAAVDSQGSGPAAAVAALGATTNIAAAVLATAGGNTYSDASTKAAIDGVTVNVEARVDALGSKIDEVIAALKAADLMAV